MQNELIIERGEGWAQIQVNREAQRNAMNRATRQGLLRAFEDLGREAKAIILTGTGVAFCAGMDLKEREADRQAGIEGAGEEWIAVNMAIKRHPSIFIAAVNGLALGGGAIYLSQSSFWSVTADIAGRHTGVVSGLMNVGCQVGGALTASLTPWIAARYGWAAAFGTGAGVVVLGIAAWAIVDPRRLIGAERAPSHDPAVVAA